MHWVVRSSKAALAAMVQHEDRGDGPTAEGDGANRRVAEVVISSAGGGRRLLNLTRPRHRSSMVSARG
jgi:hypothetical protein